MEVWQARSMLWFLADWQWVQGPWLGEQHTLRADVVGMAVRWVVGVMTLGVAGIDVQETSADLGMEQGEEWELEMQSHS